MPNILSRAELLLQAKNYSGTGAWLDESGNSHDAQLGSTAGADANDPEFLAHSGDNYVRLPGAAGNYVSSADVNLLDADTAHIYQSQPWSARAQVDTLTHETEATATYGGKVLQFLAASPTNNVSVRTNTPGNGPVISGSTQYSLSIRARTLGGVARTAFVVIDSYAAAVWQGQIVGSNVTLPADGSWVDVTVTGTSHASADNALCYLKVSDAIDNEVFQVDRACLRAGSDATFVPSLRIVGDLDMRAKVAADDYTPAARNAIAYTYNGASASGFYARINTGGGFLFGWDATSATFSPTVVDGTAYELRFTRDVSTGDCYMYVNGVAETKQTAASGAALVSDYQLAVGYHSQASTFPFDGDIYWVEVRDGIGGPVVARYDADDASEPFATQTGATDGRTWTYNRSGSGLYVVDRPAFGLHTDDGFIVAGDLDVAADESISVIAVGRTADAVLAGALLTTKAHWTDNAGFSLVLTSDVVQFKVADGSSSTQATKGSVTDRVTFSAAGVRNVVDDDVTAFLDAAAGTPATDNTSAALPSAHTHLIGQSFDFSSYAFNGELMAVALFREALTDDEIAAVGNALAGLAPGTGEYTDQEALGAIRNRLLYEGTHTEATAPRELVGALNAFLGTTSGDVEGALNEKIGSGYVGVVQACNTLLAGAATVYEENDGLRKLAELYVP